MLPNAGFYQKKKFLLLMVCLGLFWPLLDSQKRNDVIAPYLAKVVTGIYRCTVGPAIVFVCYILWHEFLNGVILRSRYISMCRPSAGNELYATIEIPAAGY